VFGEFKWCEKYLDSREAFKTILNVAINFEILLLCFTTFRRILRDNVSGFVFEKKPKRNNFIDKRHESRATPFQDQQTCKKEEKEEVSQQVGDLSFSLGLLC
jgi:hypothetical protein